MPPVDLRTSNNPRGVAILPPAPRPVYVPPPRQLTTVANPRGVAIIPPTYVRPVQRVPPSTPRALTSANNPRGVAIVQPPSKPTVNDLHARALTSTFHDAGPTGDYGTKAVNAFKQTDAYKQAVLETFLHQAPHQRQAIVSGALKNTAAPESKMILDYVRQTTRPAITGGAQLVSPDLYGAVVRQAVAQDKGINLGSAISGALGTGLKGVDWALNLRNSLGIPASAAQPGVVQAGGLPADFARAVVHTPVNVARAWAEKPASFPATAKGLGEIALGVLPAIPEAIMHPEKTAQAFVKDINTRYGPVAAGNDRAQINRIKASPQGAAPEVTDIIGAAGGLDVTAGRAAVTAARVARELTGREGAIARHLLAPRPMLRVAGGGDVASGAVRTQELAQGAGKITAQRLEDALRRATAGRSQIVPEAGQVVPVFGKRAQRVAVSKVSARTRELIAQMRNRELHASKGAQGVYARLGKWEKRAFPYALEGGIPLRSGPAVAQDWIDRHIAVIQKERATVGHSPGNRIPDQYRQQLDDLPRLQALRENVGKWLTPKLADAVDTEGARAIRIDARSAEVRGLTPATAQARRLRVQGELLGHTHPNDVIDAQVAELTARQADLRQHLNEVIARGEQSTRPAEEQLRLIRTLREQIDTTGSAIDRINHPDTRQALLEQYARAVRTDAGKAGLPAEPGYLHHRGDPNVDFSAYTTGAGGRAMPGVVQSRFAQWRGGTVDRSIDAYVDGLARSIKRPYQWRLVSEQMKQSMLPTAKTDVIRAATGHNPDPAGLTPFELRQVLAHQGIKKQNYMLVNPARLRAKMLQDIRDEATGSAEAAAAGPGGGGVPGTTIPELESSQHIADALAQHDVAIPGDGAIPTEFQKTRGWFAIPREAYDEIYTGAQPSGKWGRRWGKVQGLNAIAILGGSPSFVVMNSLADAMMATFATRGKILKDALDYPSWFRNLTDEEKDKFIAESRGRVHFRPEKMGSLARGQLTNQWRELQAHKLMRGIRAANPIRVLFHSQAQFSDFLRHTVLYSNVKRQALENIGKDMGPAARSLASVQQMFHVGPTTPVGEHLRTILHSQPELEKAGERTLNMLGDYTRFTAGERRWLNNRAVLFYSFLRYAVRTLFYTLPVKHPIITGLVAALSRLHNDEVRKLLGGQDLPWAYSRLYIHHDGKLYSIDTQRASPVSSIGTDIPTQGIQGIAQTVAPEAQALLAQIYGVTPTGQPHPRGVFSALDDLLSLSYPYRAGKLQYFGTAPQQPGSIPFIHELPQSKKTKAAQAYQQAKIQAGGTMTERQLASVLGLWPRADTNQVIAADRILKQQAKQRTAAKALLPKKTKTTISSIWGTTKAKPPPTSVAGLAQILQSLQQGKAPPANAGVPPKKSSNSIWGSSSSGVSSGASKSNSIWSGG